MARHNKLVWFVLLILVASFGFGGFGQGGGCLGTQSQVRMIGGSSGQFIMLTPANGVTTGLQPTFSWTNFPVDLTSYTLQISTNAYFTGTSAYQNVRISRSATAFQVPAGTLLQNTSYFWRIIAVDADTGTSTIASNAPFTFNTGVTPGQFNLLSPIPPSETIYSTTPTLIWSESAQATGYNIQIDTENTFNEPVIYQVDLPVTTTYQVPAGRLTNGVTYYWRVRALNSTNISGPTVASNAPAAFFIIGAPGSFLLSAPAINSRQQTITPTLSWTGAIQATTYRVEISLNTTYTPTIGSYSDITDTSFSVPAGVLQNNNTYYWRAIAVNVVGETTATNNNPPYSFRVDISPQPFTQSSPISATEISTLTPTFSWTTSNLATDYTMEIATSSAFTPSSSTMRFPTISSTTYTLPAGRLVDSQTYWWRVFANNATGVITPSSNAPLSFKTNVTPRAFTLYSVLSGTAVDTLIPTFTWTTSDLASDYDFQISTDVNFTSFISITGIATTSTTIRSGILVDNQTYWWKVIAKSTNTALTTTASNAPYRFTVNIDPRSFTLNTVVSGTTLDTLTPTFTWTPSDLASDYTLQVSTDVNFISKFDIIGIAGTSYTLDGGLINQQSYWWRVIANSNNTADTTIASNAPYRFSVNVGPRSFTLTTPVTGTELITVTPVFTWSVSERATIYTLKITDTASSSLVYENVNILTNSFTLPSGVLSDSKSYLWSVFARNAFTTDATQVLAYNAPLIFSVNVSPGIFSLSMPISGSIMASLTPTLQWGPSNLATTYYLQIDDDEAFTEPYRYENRGITATSFTIPLNALEMGINYWWRVRAVNDFGQPLASNAPYSFRPTTAPLSFYLVSPNNSSVIQDSLAPTFTWTSSMYAVTYTLQISELLSFATLVTTTPFVTSATSFRIPNGTLETARTYYWRVVASNSQGQGQTIASNGPFNFTTQVLPTAFTLISPQNGVITYTLTPVFMWSASTILTGYTIQVATAVTFTPSTIVYENAAIAADINSFAIPSGILIGNTVYYWRIIARNVSGTTTATNAPFQFTAGAPPGLFKLGAPISGTVEVALTPTLTWVYAANATGYIVEMYLNSITGTVVRSEPVGVTNTYNVQPGVLSSRRTYYWKVIAVNDFGTTTATNIEPYDTITYSVFDTFVPNTPPDPFNITSPLNGSSILSYTPMLTWNDSVGETSYEIQVVTNTSYFSNPNLFVYSTTGIARNITDFTLGIDVLPDVGTYYWRVIAKNSFGNTIASNAPFAMVVNANTSPWKPISNKSFSMFEGRVGHTAVWTGTEMLLWGGSVISGGNITYFGDGVRYNPTMDEWDYINDLDAPSTRTGHTGLWTGSEMVIWGGRNSDINFLNDGARYNPSNDTWTPLLDPTNAPISRCNHIAVWSPGLGLAGQMIIWGGYGWNITESYVDYNTGGRYDMWTNTWSSLPLQSTNQYYTLRPGNPIYNEPPLVYDYFSGTVYAPTARATGVFDTLPGHTGVWDEASQRLIIWGGLNATGNTLDTGGIWYASNNAWYEFTYPASSTPYARSGHTAVWTGSQMCIFGGNTGGINYPINTGTVLTSYDGRYMPASPRDWVVQLVPPTYRRVYNDSWTTFPAVNCPSSRTGHTAVWTGMQMLVWGGGISDGSGNYFGYLNTGGVYRPTGNYWLTMTTTAETPIARVGHTAVWTGTEMIVWGGQGATGYFDDGGRYNPSTDSWIEVPSPLIGPPISREFHTMIFTSFDWQNPVFDKDLTSDPSAPNVNDRYLIAGGASGLWSGQSGSLTVWNGSVWAFTPPVAGMCVMVKDENLVYKYNGTNWVVTTASPQVIIWGGWNGSRAFRNGSRYNPVTDDWSLLKNSGAPTARYGQTAVWTSPITTTITPTMLVWGGFNGTSYTNTGGRYNPSVGRGGLWSSLPTAGAPSPRAWHSALWAYDGPNNGNEMIVWGGYDGTNYYNDGAIYDAFSNAWSPMTTTNRPDVRMNHSAVWVNTLDLPYPPGMIVWGGQSVSNNRLNTGGIYVPISDTWLSTSTPPLGFVGREGHTASWTGTGPEQGWTTYSIIDSINDVGQYSSIALSPSGRAHIAYYDATYRDLKYTTNVNGAWDSTGVSVDTAGNVGEYASIAIDSNGYLHISYYDRTNADLKYATNSSGIWQTATLDSSGDVGLYTDIAVGAGNQVHISYYDWTNSKLKYIRGVTGSWNAPITVDFSGSNGKYSSIAVDNLNKAYISYYDATAGNLKYATVTGGVADPITSVDLAPADVGYYSSIGIDSAKNVYISYYDMTNGRLKFASNVTGAFVIENQPDPTLAYHGEYCSLAINDNPTTTTVHISYYDSTNMRLKYISKSSVYTTTWNEPVIIDESANVGQYSNIAVDQSKNSYISYYDTSSRGLKYATDSWTWRNKMIVWGGYDGVNYLNNGAMYDPVTDSWREIATLNAPSGRAYHNATWAEWTDWLGRRRSELVVWGGWNGSNYLNDGAHYDPALDRWITINSLGAPVARTYHKGLWMDFIRPDNDRVIREMIIWGGAINGGFTQSGSRYKP